MLFWAYRDGKFTPAKGKKLYAKQGDMMAAQFGTQTAFDPLTAVPGDILTYVNAGHVNHVAMYESFSSMAHGLDTSST